MRDFQTLGLLRQILDISLLFPILQFLFIFFGVNCLLQRYCIVYTTLVFKNAKLLATLRSFKTNVV